MDDLEYKQMLEREQAVVNRLNRDVGKTAPATESLKNASFYFLPDDANFTESARGALLWVLYNHQGAHSDVGQPIRFALGMGQFERLTDEQIALAKKWKNWAQNASRG